MHALCYPDEATYLHSGVYILQVINETCILSLVSVVLSCFTDSLSRVLPFLMQLPGADQDPVLCSKKDALHLLHQYRWK